MLRIVKTERKIHKILEKSGKKFNSNYIKLSRKTLMRS